MALGGTLTAFSEEQAARLTGLSRSQLRTWDKAGFFSPDFAHDDRRAAYSRIYSFRDIVGLRTMAKLKQEFRVSTQELKKVALELERRGFDHWSEVRLYVVNKEVHFREPEKESVEGVWTGQRAMLPVIDVMSDVQEKITEFKRKQESSDIKKSRYLARNSSVIDGTRIPTATIRRYVDAGLSYDRIIADYPSLTNSDIERALEYEKHLARAG